MVSNNTIVGSGSSASIGAWGYPDPDSYGQTTFQGNDISGTSSGIVVSEANNVTIKNNLIHAVGNGVVLSDPGHFSAELDALDGPHQQQLDHGGVGQAADERVSRSGRRVRATGGVPRSRRTSRLG